MGSFFSKILIILTFKLQNLQNSREFKKKLFAKHHTKRTLINSISHEKTHKKGAE